MGAYYRFDAIKKLVLVLLNLCVKNMPVLFVNKKAVLFLLLLLFSLNKSFLSEKRFDEINMASGLSHNSALCLLENQNGFVWIGHAMV